MLRPLSLADLDALLEVQREGAVVGLAHIFPQDRFPFPTESIRARWEAELADPGVDCFVVVHDGEVAGFAATRGDELLHFGTARHTWGSGLADAAHDEVVAHLAAAGHERAWLRVFEENARAVRFYLRHGWRPTDVTERSTFPPHAVLRRFELGLALTVRDAVAGDVAAVCRFGEEHIPVHYAPLIGEAAAAEQVLRWWNRDVITAAVEAGRVVVAEDDSLIRMDLTEMLRDEGYEIVGEAPNGQVAVDLTESLKPDLVIMDIKMPVRDGIDAASEIARKRLAPVVMLTAFSQRDFVERARDAGAMAYLVKPFNQADLVPAIEVALSRFRELKALEAEVASMGERFEARKLIERAKGLLMEKQQLTEPEAFRWIQRNAMDKRATMKAVAQIVVETLGDDEA